jgi:hypothetical protein
LHVLRRPSSLLRRYAFVDNPRTSTQAEIWTSDDHGAVLSFRGTELTDPRDLATDIFFTQRQVDMAAGDALVHSGFGRAFMSVRDAVLTVLTRLDVLDRSPDTAAYLAGSQPQLLLTGHSLGGALALLAAREVHTHSPARAVRSSARRSTPCALTQPCRSSGVQLGTSLGASLAIYTFGAPRVGNTALALDVVRSTAQSSGPYRVVNHDDYVVPRYPRGTPANRIWDYVHAGATVLLPPSDASSAASVVSIAAVGDAAGCPLKEVNPRYRGVLPPWLFEWSRTNLPAFVLQEARSVWRLLTRGGVSAHFMSSYDERLTAACTLPVVGHATPATDAASLEYLDLLRATWEGETV